MAPVLGFCLAAPPALVAQDPPPAYAAYVRGAWTVDRAGGAEQVTAGDWLPGGATLRPPVRPAAGDSIVVLLPGGDRKVCGCGAEGRCGGPVVLSGSEPKREFRAAMTAMLRRSLGLRDRSYQPLIVRGAGLREMVAVVVDGRLDLSQAFVELPAGGYRVRLRPLTGEDLARGAVHMERMLGWYPSQPLLLGAEEIGPGLYEVSIAGEPLEAWVLVSGPDRERSDREVFASAGELVAAWGYAPGEEGGRALLRSVLHDLALVP